MGTISFSASFLLSAFLLHLCSYSEVAARYPVTGSNREALGGGYGGYYSAPPPPPEPLCPPPPPPPSPISPRIIKVYPVIQAFKKQIFYDLLNIIGTWDEKVKDVCKYKGFPCAIVPDFKQRALAGVDFNGYGFAGHKDRGLSLFGFIEKLPDIVTFHANSNNFTGGVPAEISTFRYFYELDLSNNKLTGCLPYEIGLPKIATFFDVGPECRKLIRKKVLDIKMNCIIDLPEQRSKADCAAFYSEARYPTCPNEKSLTKIPCKTTYYSDPLGASADQPTVAASPPLSYSSLIPHKK
ncbi:hypothetical protein CJ030_MR8G028967 [Morella rubra]|uniref:Uncharacterized protein n=1 Tax=Morella rubra TaxID=262757 RepID=A0A6A1UQI9_9ROSI|nr:hypothetical protein CJ030_MR8G028967 [Morella rubra]